MEAPRPSLMSGYRPGLRSVVGASATAYGYTLTVGPTSMLLTHGYGPPEAIEVLLFCCGAILAFALVGALAFGGVSEHFGDHPKKIQLWGSFHFLSVGLAVGAAYLVGAFVPSALGWPLGAFAATATYLMVVGFENAAADLERRRIARLFFGVADLSSVSSRPRASLSRALPYSLPPACWSSRATAAEVAP